MEAVEKSLPSLQQVDSAAHFAIGFSGSMLEQLARSWDRLMATPQGRAEALAEVVRAMEPLNLDLVERVGWAASFERRWKSGE